MLITSEHQRGHSLPKPFLYSGTPSLPLSFSRLSFLSLSYGISFFLYPCLCLSLRCIQCCCLFYFCRCSLLQRLLSLALNLRFSFSSVSFSFCHCFCDLRFPDVPSRFLSSCCDFLLDSLAESSLILLLDSLSNYCFRTSETLISLRTLRFPIFPSVAKIYNFDVSFPFWIFYDFIECYFQQFYLSENLSFQVFSYC